LNHRIDNHYLIENHPLHRAHSNVCGKNTTPSTRATIFSYVPVLFRINNGSNGMVVLISMFKKEKQDKNYSKEQILDHKSLPDVLNINSRKKVLNQYFIKRL